LKDVPTRDIEAALAVTFTDTGINTRGFTVDASSTTPSSSTPTVDSSTSQSRTYGNTSENTPHPDWTRTASNAAYTSSETDREWARNNPTCIQHLVACSVVCQQLADVRPVIAETDI
jgi:hypothetical protein